MLHCRILACNSSVSFESRYDTCSSCFPDDSCPHQSTHCAARPTRLRPLPHAPPPRERHRLHRFRTFPDVSGRSWKFPEVPGRSFPDVSGRSGEGGAALPGPPEMGHTPRQAPPDREPRPTVHDSRDRGSAARTDRAFLPGGRRQRSAQLYESAPSRLGCRGICGSGCMGYSHGSGRTCRTTRCRLNSDLLIDPACAAAYATPTLSTLGYLAKSTQEYLLRI